MPRRDVNTQRQEQIAEPRHEEDQADVEYPPIRQYPTCHDDHIGGNGREEILDRRTHSHQEIDGLHGHAAD